jgi:hypothetical protein
LLKLALLKDKGKKVRQMAKVDKFVKANLHTLYSGYSRSTDGTQTKKSKMSLKKSMSVDQFYHQMMNIAE